ncbi:MAG: hypothetical protein QXV17_09620 [Candidatus Micrarchaeaceae archaeon]
MPCQLMLAQGKKPAFPEILANVRNDNEYISTNQWNTYVWYTLNNKISLQLPTDITIIGFYMSNYANGDVGGLYNFSLSNSNISPPGLSSSSAPPSGASVHSGSFLPITTIYTPVSPIPDFDAYPYNEFPYLSAFMQDTIPYWIPNSNYYIELVYKTNAQPSGAPATISPPVNLLFSRLLVVQP